MTPNKDIIKYIESIPYGNITLVIDRINHKTVSVTTFGEETLKYVDNNEAMADINSMIANLVNIGYTGEATVKLTLKDGQINLVGIFNKKETKYKG